MAGLFDDFRPYLIEFLSEHWGPPDQVGVDSARWGKTGKRACSIPKLAISDFSGFHGGILGTIVHLKLANKADASKYLSKWLRSRTGRPPKFFASTLSTDAKGSTKAAHKQTCDCPSPEYGEVSYPYRDEFGDLKYVKSRKWCLVCGDKSFCQYRFVDGNIVYNLDGQLTLPYRLDQWYHSGNNFLHLAEGEKCADFLWHVENKHATSVDKWTPEITKYFRGFDVVIFRDFDATGEQKFNAAVAALTGVANSIYEDATHRAAGTDLADRLEKLGPNPYWPSITKRH